jgi:hypothetical protein
VNILAGCGKFYKLNFNSPDKIQNENIFYKSVQTNYSFQSKISSNSPPVVFPCFFLSCKANAKVKTRKDGARPALFHILLLGLYIVIWVVRLLFVLFCVLFVCKCILPPGDNPIAVNIYIYIFVNQ